MGLLWAILLGILAGWIAGQIWKGAALDYSVISSWVLSAVCLGSFTASLIGLAAQGLLGELVVAVAGAILFLWLVNYFSGKKK